MIEVSLEIKGSTIPIPPKNSITKYIVKTLWCEQQIEDDGEKENLYIKLPELSSIEYTRKKESGLEIILFIEVWYVPKKQEDRDRLESIFVGLSRYSLNELIECPYLNPAIKCLDIERIFEDYCCGKLYAKISTVIHSDNKELYSTNTGPLLSISTKSDPSSLFSTQQFMNFPPEVRRRLQEALFNVNKSSHLFDTENQNGTNIPKDSGDDNNVGDDDDDDYGFKLNKQSQVSKKNDYGKRKIPVPTKTALVKTQSPSVSKNHGTNSPHDKIDLAPKKTSTIQKSKTLNTIISNDNNNVFKTNNSPRSKLKSVSKTPPTKVPHAVAHDLLTSPDFPFQIPAVQAIEKKLQFARTPCKDSGRSYSNTHRVSDSPPFFRYTPFANLHRPDDYYSHHIHEAESPYQADIKKNQPRPTERREPLETSAEEIVAFLNESFSKTYGERVEEIRMKNNDLTQKGNPKQDEKSTQRKMQQQQNPSKVTVRNRDQQVDRQSNKSKDDNLVPSSVKLIYAATKSNGNKDTNGMSSSSSVVPGMQITKYKPSDRSEKLTDPFRSPSKRKMAANFPES